MLVEMNQNRGSSNIPMCPVTHQIITQKYEEITDLLCNSPHIRFCFSYFIIKISIADIYKENPKQIVELLYTSIRYVLDKFTEIEDMPSRTSQNVSDCGEKYIGPNDLDKHDLEQDLLDALTVYTTYMEMNQLEYIIERSKGLKIDRVRIHVYEDKGNFEKCISTFLHSEGSNPQDIFPWLKGLYQKMDMLTEDAINRIKDEIVRVIKELVKADSCKTSEVIDDWLPHSQAEIIYKLGSNIDLQLRYLQDFLNERESEISQKVNSTNLKDASSKQEINQLKDLLRLHVRLLAEKNSPELKNVVMKSYYPADCLDKIEDDSTIVKEALAYLSKRCGDIEKSLKLFIGLLMNIPQESVKNELLYGTIMVWF